MPVSLHKRARMRSIWYMYVKSCHDMSLIPANYSHTHTTFIHTYARSDALGGFVAWRRIWRTSALVTCMIGNSEYLWSGWIVIAFCILILDVGSSTAWTKHTQGGYGFWYLHEFRCHFQSLLLIGVSDKQALVWPANKHWHGKKKTSTNINKARPTNKHWHDQQMTTVMANKKAMARPTNRHWHDQQTSTHMANNKHWHC